MNKDIGFIIFLLLLAAILSFILYRPHKNKFLFFLRTLSAFFLFLFIWNPTSEKILQHKIKPTLNLLIDYSLSTKNFEKISDSITNAFLKDKVLRKKFNFHIYYFTDTLHTIKPKQRGKYTDIYQALEKINNIGSRKTKQPVILLSDGNITKGKDYLQAASTMPYLKIFPVVIGDTSQVPNLKIEQVDYNPTVKKGNFFYIKTRIIAENIHKDIQAEVVIKKKDKIVFSKTISLKPSKNFKEITAKFQALQLGLELYTVEIRPLEKEKFIEDNVENIWIHIIKNKALIGLLYGKIHPDIGVIHRILTKTENYEVEIKNHLSLSQNYDLLICVQPQSEQIKQLKNTKKPIWWITGIHTDWKAINKADFLFRRQTTEHLTEEYFAIENKNFHLFNPPSLPSYDLPPLKDFFGQLHFNVPPEILYYARIKNEITSQALWAFFPDQKQAVTFGQGLWKWYLQEKKHENTEHIETLVNKTLAYLISSPSVSQLNVQARQKYSDAFPIQIKISAYNRLMELNPSAELNFKLFFPGGEIKNIPLYYKEPYFIADLGILKPGNYTFEVIYHNYHLHRKGGFTVIPQKIEPEHPANTEALNILAQTSGGKTYFYNKTHELINYLRTASEFPSILKEEKKYLHLTDRWIWLLFFVLTISLEWFYRKYRGWI